MAVGASTEGVGGEDGLSREGLWEGGPRWDGVRLECPVQRATVAEAELDLAVTGVIVAQKQEQPVGIDAWGFPNQIFYLGT